jgi:hypothetical protein
MYIADDADDFPNRRISLVLIGADMRDALTDRILIA